MKKRELRGAERGAVGNRIWHLEILRLVRSTAIIRGLVVVVVGLRSVARSREAALVARAIQIDARDRIGATLILGDVVVGAAHQAPHQDQDEDRKRKDAEWRPATAAGTGRTAVLGPSEAHRLLPTQIECQVEFARGFGRRRGTAIRHQHGGWRAGFLAKRLVAIDDSVIHLHEATRHREAVDKS